MILGLDISTSIVGFTIVDQGEIVKTFAIDLRNKNKFPDIYSKYNHIQGELLDIQREYKIEHIFIEQSLQMFRSGFSSAKTLSTLSSFNGVVTYLCYRELGIKAEHIQPHLLASLVASLLKGEPKAKEQVVKFLLDNEPKFVVEYTKSGNLKPKYYDIADSIVIAKAGHTLVEQRKNNNS
jgi:Holliday junction resolvasome RuvABC endonuclease subunit